MPVRERTSHKFVGSTRVDRAWYHAAEQAIEVQFVDGVRWEFRECGVQTWENFCKTSSPGRFIHDILNRKPNGSV